MGAGERDPIARQLEELNRLERGRFEVANRRAEERHRQLLERGRAESRIFISALSDIDRNIQRNNDRLDEMGESIRANTQAVLSVLDRLAPP